MKTESTRHFSRKRLHSAWAPWLALLIGLAFTAAAALQLSREVKAKDFARFEMEAMDVSGDIERRLETYIVMLMAGAGFMEASDMVTRDEFRTYVSRLELQTRYPGIQGVGLALRVPAEQKEEFERQRRETGDRSFRIYPNDGQAEFFTIVHLEPMDRRNAVAIGYDMWSEPTRRIAMQRAADTAEPSATGLVTLVQEIDEIKQPGFLIYTPIYGGEIPETVEERRRKLVGFVYSPFRAQDLLDATLRDTAREMVQLQVYDGTEIHPQKQLFSSDPTNFGGEARRARFESARQVEIAGHPWTLRLQSGPAFEQLSEAAHIRRVVLIGVLLSLALFGLTWRQERVRRTADVERFAAQQEAALRREAEATLRREKEFTDVVVDSLPGMFYVIDQDGRYLRWNPTLERVTGYTHEQVAEGSPYMYFKPDYHALLTERINDVFQHGHSTLEAPLLTADGREIPYLFTGARTMINGRLCLVGLAIDITERKRTEEELARHRERLEELVASRTTELEQTHQRLRLSERMAALGTLLAGLGHDMGNLLLPIRLRLDAIEARDLTSQTHEDTQAIRKAAEYLQRLVNGLRMFAIDPEAQTGAGDDSATAQTALNEWWKDVEPFLRNAVPREVSIDHDFPSTLPRVKIAKHLLTQVVFNLVQNSGEVLRGREDGLVKVMASASDDDRSISIVVEDNGPGMTAEVQRRCMEPFFTTKTRALSTGLGLALVHTIVQRAGGLIRLDTAPGAGTRFTLLLTAAPAALHPHRGQTALQRVRVSLRDERMRAYVSSLLIGLGFDVSSDGEAGRPSDHAHVWLTDNASTDQIKSFLNGDRAQGKRLVWFGPAPQDLPMHEAVAVVSGELKPSVIREALHRMAEDIRSDVRDEIASR